MSLVYDRFGRARRRTVADIVREADDERMRRLQFTAVGLTTFFMLLWLGTMFLWAKYPWVLAGIEHLRRRLCE